MSCRKSNQSRYFSSLSRAFKVNQVRIYRPECMLLIYTPLIRQMTAQCLLYWLGYCHETIRFFIVSFCFGTLLSDFKLFCDKGDHSSNIYIANMDVLSNAGEVGRQKHPRTLPLEVTYGTAGFRMR